MLVCPLIAVTLEYFFRESNYYGFSISAHERIFATYFQAGGDNILTEVNFCALKKAKAYIAESTVD